VSVFHGFASLSFFLDLSCDFYCRCWIASFFNCPTLVGAPDGRLTEAWRSILTMLLALVIPLIIPVDCHQWSDLPCFIRMSAVSEGVFNGFLRTLCVEPVANQNNWFRRQFMCPVARSRKISNRTHDALKCSSHFSYWTLFLFGVFGNAIWRKESCRRQP
jgi:hypothetical protein